MPYLLTLRNASHSGVNFRINGRTLIDAFNFQRHPKFHNHHVLLVSDEDWPKVMEELIYENNPHAIYVNYVIDPATVDSKVLQPLQDKIAELTASREEFENKATALKKELDSVRAELTEERAKPKGAAMTPEFAAAMELHDVFIDMLVPFRSGEEGPVQVLARILGVPEPEQPTPPPPAEPAPETPAPAPAPEVVDEVEALAIEIYDEMRKGDPEGEKTPWVPGGNSTKQDEARALARRRLEDAATRAAQAAGGTGESGVSETTALPTTGETPMTHARMRKQSKAKLLEIGSNLKMEGLGKYKTSTQLADAVWLEYEKANRQ